MIRSEAQHQEAMRRLAEERKRLVQHRGRLKSAGLSPAQLKRALDPLRTCHLQLREEVESYQRLKRGDFGELVNFDGLGRLLVAVRIASGLTQRELAERLDVHESQISRDERNEYHNITVERATRVLEAMHAQLRSVVRLTDAA